RVELPVGFGKRLECFLQAGPLLLYKVLLAAALRVKPNGAHVAKRMWLFVAAQARAVVLRDSEPLARMAFAQWISAFRFTGRMVDPLLSKKLLRQTLNVGTQMGIGPRERLKNLSTIVEREVTAGQPWIDEQRHPSALHDL